jgi:hypothetical protein
MQWLQVKPGGSSTVIFLTPFSGVGSKYVPPFTRSL